jgi:predicted ATPase
MPKITAIELENFQTIGKRTIIPIRDLTLMFGPNGAGKSSIFDALDFLKILVSDDWGYENENLINLLNKWSRNITTKTASNELGVGIQFYIDESWNGEDYPYSPINRIDRVAYFSLHKDGDYGNQFIGKNFNFYIKFKNLSEKGKDWFISELRICSETDQIVELRQDDPKNYPNAHLYAKDWISFSELESIKRWAHPDIKYQNQVLSGRAATTMSFINAREWFERRYFGDSVLEEEFIHLFQQVIDFFKFIIAEELKSTPLVRGSRTVPSSKETIHLVPGEKNFYSAGKDSLTPGFRFEWSPMLKTLDPIINKDKDNWFYMCKAVSTAISSQTDVINTEWDLLSALGKINSLLREELFIENGYQLTAEVFYLAEFYDIDNYQFEDKKYYPKLVRLYLTDSHQQSLEIEDVGSGIGYVLPVLASLSQDDISLIQQPELHLHPKLQSMLGDAIVKAVENKKNYRAFTLIETHSEHILLRIMRLLKNSSKRKDEVISPLNFEKIAVLYFDPLPNGETEVKRLRLAPDGQLIDRWPGGFFNERFRDLFDE